MWRGDRKKLEVQGPGQVRSALQPDQGGPKTIQEIFVLKAEGDYSPGSVEVGTWLVLLGPQPLSSLFCWEPSLHRGSTASPVSWLYRTGVCLLIPSLASQGTWRYQVSLADPLGANISTHWVLMHGIQNLP